MNIQIEVPNKGDTATLTLCGEPYIELQIPIQKVIEICLLYKVFIQSSSNEETLYAGTLNRR